MRKRYIWYRRIGILIVLLMFVANTYTLFDLFPNQILFPIYGFILAVMTICAMRRY